MAAVGLVLGILLGTGIHWYFILAVVVLFAAIAVSFCKRGQYGYLVSRCIFLAVMLYLGVSGYRKNEGVYRQCEREVSEGDRIEIQGTVTVRKEQEDQTIYELSQCYANLTTGIIPCMSVQVESARTDSSKDEYLIGTTLIMTGTIEKWKQAENEGNFDAASYYKSKRMTFCLKDCEVEQCIGKPDAVAEFLKKLQKRFAEVYRNGMRTEYAGILTTMLVGDKTLLDEKEKAGYQAAGISHILAISGLHVSMIGMTFYKTLRKMRFSFARAGLLAGTMLYFYGKMTGMGCSTTRAVFMFVFSIFAAWVGRSYDSLNALGGAAIILLLQNPFLLWNASFLFSFSAVLGVVWVARVFTKIWERDEAEKGVRTAQGDETEKGVQTAQGVETEKDVRTALQSDRQVQEKKGIFGKIGRTLLETACVSLCIQLLTVPLTAYFYYEIPVYAVIFNALVLPVVGVLLGTGIVGGIAGFFSEIVSKILLAPCQLLLAYYSFLCNINEKLPSAVKITGQPSIRLLVCYYMVLIVLVLWMERREKKSCLFAGLALLVGVLLFPRESGFELDVLSVGQGDGIFVRTEDNVTCFIDGGSTSVGKVGIYRILPFLKKKGIAKISYWFISHTDEDHISGLRELLEAGYEIEYLIFTERAEHDDALMKLVRLAKEQNTNVLFWKEGDVLKTGTAKITCIAPDAAYAAEDKNALSLVLLYEEGDFCALFTGDISAAEETYLMEQKKITQSVSFYKAAHHGSNYSNSKEWLEVLSPQCTAISCGRKNRYGHPGEDAVRHIEASGSDIVYTMYGGQIKVQKKDGELVVQEFLGEHKVQP